MKKKRRRERERRKKISAKLVEFSLLFAFVEFVLLMIYNVIADSLSFFLYIWFGLELNSNMNNNERNSLGYFQSARCGHWSFPDTDTQNNIFSHNT